MSHPNGGRSATYRDRIGVSLMGADAPSLVAAIEAADAAGIAQVWTTQTPVSFDALTLFAAAMERTSAVRFGTSIVPTYPRHPLALAQQAATVAALGPGRLRLGVGPSHRPVIEHVYGIEMESPLAHLREYVAILRAALWEDAVDHAGRFLTARVTVQNQPRVPILISALSEGAFRLAGEIADGAISWNCPAAYLLDSALPALRAGAESAGRDAPPLVAHAWVALGTDTAAIREAARQRINGYGRLPFYAAMFAAAGFPVDADGNVSDALLDDLVVFGEDAAVAARLREMLDAGLDELLLTLIPLADEAADRDRLFRLVGRL